VDAIDRNIVLRKEEPMLRSLRFRPAAAFLVVLAVLTLVVPARADNVPFTATGGVIVIDEAFDDELGFLITFTIEGSGDPLGDFTGGGTFYLTALGSIDRGQVTFTDGGGDEISLAFDGILYPDSTFDGEFVILGGTGMYDGAAGNGTFMGTTVGGITVILDGVICR
jgi:hypothetical protein